MARGLSHGGEFLSSLLLRARLYCAASRETDHFFAVRAVGKNGFDR